MSAYDDANRNIIWINSLANLGRLSRLATALGGSISDGLLPRTAQPADVKRVQQQARSLDGKGMGCGIYEIAFTSETLDHPHVRAALAGHTDPDDSPVFEIKHAVSKEEHESGNTPKGSVVLGNDREVQEFARTAAANFVEQVKGDVHRLRDAGASPGYVDLDNEVSDVVLPAFNEQCIALLRDEFPSLFIRENVDPNKWWSLPTQRMVTDRYLYAAIQTYFGDMSAVATWELYRLLIGTGIPKQKIHMCIGAATMAKASDLDWRRVSAVPSVYYRGQAVKRLPGPTTIFSDDLADDAGLLPS
jgi:hypothetical protein